MKNELRERWKTFAKKAGATKEISTVWEWIESAYTEKGRFYHNFDHIKQCLTLLDSLPDSDYLNEVNRIAIEFAIWFHDIVYNTTTSTNEEDSAFLFRNAFGVLKIENDYNWKNDVQYMILQTTHNATNGNNDPVTQLFLDIDLSILSQESDIFNEYELNIRKEYEWVPLDVYREKRAEILEQFLQRSKIYLSDPLQQYDAQARANLARSIAVLKQIN